MSSGVLLFLTTFVASAVEAVEALTIVLAVGVVRGWPRRSSAWARPRSRSQQWWWRSARH